MVHECCWKGNLLSLKHGLPLCELKLQKQEEEWNFEQHKTVFLPSIYEECHVVEVLLNAHLGYHVPFFLAACQTTAASQLRTKTLELVMYDVGGCEKDPLSTYGRFDVPKSQLPCDGFHLANGPSVIWNEESVVHIVHGVNSAGVMTQESIDVQEYVKGHAVTSIDTLWTFDWEGTFDDQQDTLLLLVRLLLEQTRPCGASESVMGWMCFLVRTKYVCRGSLSVQVLPASLCVPCEYGYIATCMALHRHLSVDETTGDIVMKRQFIVGTSYKQVLVFEEGALVHYITTDSTPQCVVPLKTMFGCLTVTVQLETGGVCCYEVAKPNYKINGLWCKASNVLTGDFAGLGHDQVLIYCAGGTDKSKFIVTDFCEFSTEEKTQMECSCDPCPESLLCTVNAMELQKHSGEAYLTDKERELQRKSALLEGSVHLMTSLGYEKGKMAVTSDPCLVSVLPGDVDETVTGDCLPTPTVTSPLKVHSWWQRVISERWVVGMVINNASSHALHRLKLSLASSSEELTESVYQVIGTEHINQVEPPTKKLKLDTKPITENSLLDMLQSDQSLSMDNSNEHMLLPGGQICAVLSMPLSVDDAHHKTGTVIACWELTEADRTSIMVEGIKQVKISLEQMSLGEFNVKDKCLHLWNGRMLLKMDEVSESLQDLMCLLATRKSVQLEVRSRQTNLLRLPAILKAALASLSPLLRSKKVSAAQQQPDVLINSGGSETNCDGFTLHVASTMTSGCITVLYKSSTQLSMVVALLKRCLPVDVCLTIKEERHSQEALMKTLMNVESEVRRLCNCLGL